MVVVASAVPGLETVLRRNDHWSGVVAKGPFLDELHRVLVPDPVPLVLDPVPEVLEPALPPVVPEPLAPEPDPLPLPLWV